MRSEVPRWVFALIVVLAVIVIGIFINHKLDDGTVGSVTPPGPPPSAPPSQGK